MKWKKRSNLAIVIIFSLAYTIVTLLNIIGPLHISQTGSTNTLGSLAIYSIIYWLMSLILIWVVYFSLKEKPELLFFLLIILGIMLILAEVFLWGWMGSS